MKMNKLAFEKAISELINSRNALMQPCIKLAMDNLLLPKWNDIDLYRFMFKMRVITAEQPNGCDYDPYIYQNCVRIIAGQLLFDRLNQSKEQSDSTKEEDVKRTDNFCWKISKVEDLKKKGAVKVINNRSIIGIINKIKFLRTIKSKRERDIVKNAINSLNMDFLIAHTDAENRFFVRITQELHDAGWTYCVDEWMNVDENGNAETTNLMVGDVLIINKQNDGTVTCYRIESETFEMTHSY